MKTLIERLKDGCIFGDDGCYWLIDGNATDTLLAEAAAEIERLLDDRDSWKSDWAVSELRAKEAEAQLSTEREERAKDRAFVQSVADVPLHDLDLDYTKVDLLHGRGALNKTVKTEAVVAIKTLADILRAARSRLQPQESEE